MDAERMNVRTDGKGDVREVPCAEPCVVVVSRLPLRVVRVEDCREDHLGPCFACGFGVRRRAFEPGAKSGGRAGGGSSPKST